jgi:hypothetical protein
METQRFVWGRNWIVNSFWWISGFKGSVLYYWSAVSNIRVWAVHKHQHKLRMRNCKERICKMHVLKMFNNGLPGYNSISSLVGGYQHPHPENSDIIILWDTGTTTRIPCHKPYRKLNHTCFFANPVHITLSKLEKSAEHRKYLIHSNSHSYKTWHGLLLPEICIFTHNNFTFQ